MISTLFTELTSKEGTYQRRQRFYDRFLLCQILLRESLLYSFALRENRSVRLRSEKIALFVCVLRILSLFVSALGIPLYSFPF